VTSCPASKGYPSTELTPAPPTKIFPLLFALALIVHLLHLTDLSTRHSATPATATLLHLPTKKFPSWISSIDCPLSIISLSLLRILPVVGGKPVYLGIAIII